MCRSASRAITKAPLPSGEALAAQIDSIKRLGHGRPFDSVVGLSGGRDSTYLLYRLVKTHGLRCLAAYFRTVFTPEATDQNVRNTVRCLNVPLVEVRNISPEYHRKIAREFFLLWTRRPSAALANLCCAPCKLVNRELLRITRRYRVRTLAVGDNKYEEIQFLPTFQSEDLETDAHVMRSQATKVLQIIGKGARLLARAPSLLPHLPLCVQASVLYLSPFTAYLRLRYPEVHRLDYFYQVPWNEHEVVETIQSKLGWRLPPGYTDTWRADCDFAELKNYMFYQMTGATYVDGLLSNLVRAGQLSRDEALDRLRGMPRFSSARLRSTLAALRLPENLLAPEALTAQPAL